MLLEDLIELAKSHFDVKCVYPHEAVKTGQDVECGAKHDGLWR